MASCHGKKEGFTCGTNLYRCAKCTNIGCNAAKCSNCGFPGNRCAKCGSYEMKQF